MSELKLKRPEVFKLIEMYQQNECLWNIHSAENKKLIFKQNAWERMAREFNTSAEFVKKKVKFLRTTFSAEVKKVEASEKLAEVGVEPYVPTLFYYDKMLFLKGMLIFKEKEKCPIEKENSSSEQNGFEISKTKFKESRKSDAPPAAPSAKKPKQSFREKYDEALEAIIATTKETSAGSEDMFAAFGTSVGMQLKQLPMVEAARIMSDIQRLLSDAFVCHFASHTMGSPSSEQNLQSYFNSDSNHVNPQRALRTSSDSNNPILNLDLVKTEVM